MMLATLTVLYLAVLLVATFQPSFPKRKRADKKPTKTTVHRQYKNKKEFMRAMEVERQEWLREVKAVWKELELPAEKVLTVKDNCVIDKSGRKYTTIADLLAAV